MNSVDEIKSSVISIDSKLTKMGSVVDGLVKRVDKVENSQQFISAGDTNAPVRRNPDQRLKLLNLCRGTGLHILNGRHNDGLANDYTLCGSRGMSVVDYLLAPYDFLHIIDQFIVCNFTSFSDHAPLHVRLRCILHDSQEPERNSGTSNNSYNSYRWKEELKDQCYESLTLNSGSLSQIVFSDIEKSQDGIDNYVESLTSI
ncbi:unnamed protein product [Mytilus edulis]|uniref:Endonuclease/exonuclease/phosphatase domain-containing protein n=1 Tax=Mytilus edulis TaxID=6550 RepID=A0A8S3PW71_MYTED|nr:unnamed protein product [Mytilus edulis]